ncbi:SPOR domain-containing protein [Acidobacteria bacterium AH-259-D05]|nr:SPOR domain-containing protein [Acidobacteria bacterium AH-259-D05]
MSKYIGSILHRGPLQLIALVLLFTAEAYANRAPMLSCVADRTTVTEGDLVAIQTNATDPDKDRLNFSWSATSGIKSNAVVFSDRNITAQNDSATYDSTGVKAGRYTIKAEVSDGVHQVSCSVFVIVEKNEQAPNNVTVDREPNRNPSVTLTFDKNEVGAGDSVRVNAQSSDPVANSVDYSWRADGESQFATLYRIEINNGLLAFGRHSAAPTASGGLDGTATATPSFSVPEEKTVQLNIRPDKGVRFAAQLAAYRTRPQAEGLRAMLQEEGYTAYVVEADIPGSGHYYRVRVGPFDTREEVSEVAADMQSHFAGQFPDFWIVPYSSQVSQNLAAGMN